MRAICNVADGFDAYMMVRGGGPRRARDFGTIRFFRILGLKKQCSILVTTSFPAKLLEIEEHGVYTAMHS